MDFRKLLILFLFMYSAILLHAQPVSPDSTSVVYVDSLGRWVQKTMSLDGQLYSEIQFADSSLTVVDGTEIYFYSSGMKKSIAHYHQGLLQGEVVSFYSNGAKKRVDMYEQNTLLSGECYGANGLQIIHTEYSSDVRYSGGLSALYTVISVNSQQIVLPENRSVHGQVWAHLAVNKKGEITSAKIIKSLHPLYDAEVLRICGHLAHFIPAEREGETVPWFYILKINF